MYKLIGIVFAWKFWNTFKWFYMAFIIVALVWVIYLMNTNPKETIEWTEKLLRIK